MRIPNKTLSQFRQKIVHEVITLDDYEYQVITVISIKQTSTNSGGQQRGSRDKGAEAEGRISDRKGGVKEANSPASTTTAGGTAPSIPMRQNKQRRRQEVESPCFRDDTREYGLYSDTDSSDIEPIPMSSPAVPLAQPGSTPNSPKKSTWSGGSTTMASLNNHEGS